VNGEFDRVYTAAPQPLLLSEAGRGLQVSQSPSFDQTVVWNPGADACAGLADMPADGYRHMLCVEAARVDAPAVVPAGQTWQGWQRLTLC
jgi:glucose-6-phosphate 1-epimerase